MKKALIFGVTGQDGSYLAEFLLEKNYKVHAVKRKSSSYNTNRIDHVLEKEKNFIYTGCQILNKNIFNGYKVKNFSITNIWNDLIIKKKLFGFQSNIDFYHLTDLKTFKKLQDL